MRPSPILGANLASAGVGIYAAAFGPALSHLAEAWDISLGTAGLIYTGLFAGSITASATVASLHRRTNDRLVIASGLLIAATAMALLAALDAWRLALAATVLLGIGDGMIVAGAHELVARAAKSAKGVAQGLNLLNLCFAAGATTGPIVAGVLLAAGAGRGALLAVIAAWLAASGLLCLFCPDVDERRLFESEQPAVRPSFAILAVLGVVLFGYVGAEIGLGAWVSTYAEEASGARHSPSALVTSAYWGALGLGRVTSGIAFQRDWLAERVLVIALAGALLASIALIALGEVLAFGFAAAFAAGFCFGPVWPAVLAMASRGTEGGTPAAMATFGNAGGAVVPWVQGRILVDSGPRQGIAVTAGITLVILVLSLTRLRRGR